MAIATQTEPYGDAHSDQGAPNTNYGVDAVMYVMRRTGNENRAYFAFNISSATANVSYANFSFYITGTANPTATFTDDFYFCNDQTTPGFAEMSLTWNTQDTLVDTCAGSPFFSKVRNTWTTSARYTLNITNYVNSEIASYDKKFIIKIKVSNPTDASARWLGFASKDHGTTSFHPYIQWEQPIIPMQINAVNLTSSIPNDVHPPYTSNDATPTFSILTSLNANCSISNMNGSYVPCATTGAKHHVCTMPSNKTMTEGFNYTFFKCLGALNVSRKYLTYMDTIPPVIVFNSINQTFERASLSLVKVNVTAHDASGLRNLSMYVNGTLYSSVFSPSNNSMIGFNFTPGNFMNYSFIFAAYDNISTYNAGSSGALFYNFVRHIVGINRTFGINVSGLYFYPNLSNYNFSTNTLTESGTVPQNVTANNPYLTLCNNGTSAGVLKGRINATNPKYNLRCSTRFILSSATNLTTINATLNSSIAGKACNRVWCWLDWLNASSSWYFKDEWSVT